MNSVAGSSDSIGLTGNWTKVNGIKSGSDPVRASIFTNSYNANLAFPTSTRYTLPANNTAAGTTANVWSPFGSARQISSPISFDADGSFYFSFLMYAPADGGGNWGSAVAGLLNGMPSSNTDTSKNALYFGWTYQGAAIIKIASANLPVWENANYGAVGASTTSVATGNKSWFVIVKITTASTGNDSVRIKLFAPSATVPNSDSGITWDATYLTPITGSWGYLAVQSEYNGIIDEIRGGTTYESIAGVAQDSSATITVAAGDLSYRTAKTLTAVASVAGKLTFKANNVVIPGCKNLIVNSGNSLTVNCTYKPTIRGAVTITTSLVPTDAIYNSSISSSSKLFVNQRAGNR